MPLVQLDDFIIRKGHGLFNIHEFIDGLAVSDAIKDELKAISPQNYVGK